MEAQLVSSQHQGEGAAASLMRSLETARRQLSESQEELAEAKRRVMIPGSVGSGSTDQQLMAAEQELSQVREGGRGGEEEGNNAWQCG